MSALSIYAENNPDAAETFTDFTVIAAQLKQLGVEFERWQADRQFADDASETEIIDAYQASIAKLKQQCGFQSVDVVSMSPEHPNKEQLRQKFLAEHIHRDFEVRFFVYGRGLFFLHVADKVYVVLCEQGDLISVPANTTHWFDMGANPDFKCIRLFTTADGWVAEFTGNPIAEKFPTLEQYLSK